MSLLPGNHRVRLVLFVAVLPQLLPAQTPDTTRRTPGATVSGVVYDSIARTALAGAAVQLVAADNPTRFGSTAVSDSLGRFALADVPDGRYMLGFFHPMLDSLGLEPTLRQVQVDGHRSVRADLAIPSPGRLRDAICGPPRTMDPSAVLAGVVRDARDGAPAAGVTVTAEWLELTFGATGVVRKLPRLVATTGPNGWFALCNVPSPGTIALTASRGADSTDRIEVQVAEEGFVRRELYLGAARIVVAGDTTKRADTLAPPPRRLHLGDGRLSGTVVTAVGGQPLAAAQVSIAGGPQAHANERGEWTLVDVPAGTRMLEVRAVGYYPVQRRVDVVAGAAPVRVALATLKSVLDTVKVTASRIAGRDFSGFQERARGGIGRYITAADIARKQPMETSDLFKNFPSIRLEWDDLRIERWIVMRGCRPLIFVDGALMRLSAEDMDIWVHPNEIRGIEVYAGAGIPPQFQEGLNDCGAVVIWKK